ncbi:MAG: LPS export ABC transporter periplasmic protein LptC [Bacteroidia bacterium]|nr:LPS export ABC transporter periplasmic protein LptC [Bacteroidia bacterium]
MKHPLMKFKTPFLITVIVIVTGMVLSCENKINLIPKSDLLSLPSLTVKDFKTVFNDSGRLQLEMSSPLLEQYDNIDFPYSEFRSGIKVIFYDGKTEPVVSVTAKYAKYTKTNNIWELKDSVVVINENNYKLETEVLYWDQQKDLIYTDRFVRITNEDQIMMGTGFESDPRLVKRTIKKVSAIIPLKDEE